MYVFWQMLALPLVLLVLLACTVPFTVAIKRWLPDGKLKRLLLWIPPWHRDRRTGQPKSF